MSASLEGTVRAIVAGLLPAYPTLDDEVRATIHRDVTRYVVAQIRAMPSFLGLPYRVALFGFEWLPVVRHLRPFASLPPSTQAARLASWAGASLSPMRDFVKLIRSVALLAYFDHPLVMRALEAERLAAYASVAAGDANAAAI